ncbi:MAG: tRNA lysidine(34) synthetase TilS [Phycisphaerae bacterium]|nr:tRNA lysidine(34) synthetase TilS [Phycisphaerae bacterium]
MMHAADFERLVGHALTESGVPHAARIVLAVSGGPDSVAMLSAIDAFNRRAEAGWRLSVAHLNHGLRGAESDADAEFVIAIAAQRGLPCDVERLPRRSSSHTAEDAVRRARYAFLERCARRRRATWVVVAHHADDHAETVLHRLIRGTGLRGLLGIPRVRPIAPRSRVRLVRPMLALTRTEIREYVSARRLRVREDSTNARTDVTRNFIRHRLLPLLRDELNPRSVEALRRLSEQAAWAHEFIDEVATEALRRLMRASRRGSIVFDADGLARRPRIIRAHVVLLALQRLRAPEQKLRFEHLRAVGELAAAGRAGKRVELPGGYVATRHGDEVRITRTTGATRASAHRPARTRHSAGSRRAAANP